MHTYKRSVTSAEKPFVNQRLGQCATQTLGGMPGAFFLYMLATLPDFLYLRGNIKKYNMKFKKLIPLLCLCFLSSCYTSQFVSKFSDTQVELGMSQDDFIQKFGKPFNKEMSYTYDNHKRETLFYKEDLYRGSWFIVTTAFTFVDSKLVSQEVVKEERQFNPEEHSHRKKN